MGQIFLSHVAEDEAVAREIAAGLEREGFTTWYYEEHSVPWRRPHAANARGDRAGGGGRRADLAPLARGLSVRLAGDSSGCEGQEALHALLLDVEWSQVEEDYPAWDDAFAGAVAISVLPDQIPQILPRLTAGLQRLGVEVQRPAESDAHTAARPSRPHEPIRGREPSEQAASLATDDATERESLKTVTIVFCDLTGSTSLGERLDAESLRSLLSPYFTEMEAVVAATAAWWRSSSAMRSWRCSACRCCTRTTPSARCARPRRCATDRRLNDELDQEWGVRIGTRTGVHTGEVVVGDPAVGQRLATGDAVNTRGPAGAGRRRRRGPDR